MKPLTRKEMLLDGAAKGNLDTFEPATREEVFAKRALANAGGSGGSFVVAVTFGEDNNFVKDKTFAEIENALDAGLMVYVDLTIVTDGLITKSHWYFNERLVGKRVSFAVPSINTSSNAVIFSKMDIDDGDLISIYDVNLATGG